LNTINGSELVNVTIVQWDTINLTTNLAAGGIRNAYRRCVWQAQVMPEPQFDILRALEGGTVTIHTQPYRDRNGDYVTYYGALFTNLQYQHEGPNMINVRAEFSAYIGAAS